VTPIAISRPESGQSLKTDRVAIGGFCQVDLTSKPKLKCDGEAQCTFRIALCKRQHLPLNRLSQVRLAAESIAKAEPKMVLCARISRIRARPVPVDSTNTIPDDSSPEFVSFRKFCHSQGIAQIGGEFEIANRLRRVTISRVERMDQPTIAGSSRAILLIRGTFEEPCSANEIKWNTSTFN
jgi:hypothetical protein